MFPIFWDFEFLFSFFLTLFIARHPVLYTHYCISVLPYCILALYHALYTHTIPTASGGQSFDQSWKNAQVPVPTSTNGGFIFIEGIRGNGQSGDIAVDDFTMTQGICGVSVPKNSVKFLLDQGPFYGANNLFLTLDDCLLVSIPEWIHHRLSFFVACLCVRVRSQRSRDFFLLCFGCE